LNWQEHAVEPISEQSPFDVPPQVMTLIERISAHYENVYNLPRIGARLLGLLLLYPEGLSMQVMENALQVSHASISGNLKLLGAMGYVEKITYAGSRITYYRFLPRSRVRVLRERIEHYQELIKVLQDARRDLDLNEAASQELVEMQAWAELAVEKNSQFIDEWKRYLQSDNPRKGEL
jgi:DNA-binding transcriptional regulator GbsR (MarR family)